MQFSVGPFVYTVEIIDERLMHEGDPCDGMIDLGNQTIKIFTGVRGQRRLNTLLHELRHAWINHFPAATDEESECDLSANFAHSAFQDLQSQGGIEALDALVSEAEVERSKEPMLVSEEQYENLKRVIAPLGIVVPTEIRRIGFAGRAECAVCSKTFADGNIITGAAQWHDRAKAIVVRRTLYCEGCGHLQAWLEGLTAEGSPNGVPVCDPHFISNREQVHAFLTEHPDAANVLDFT